MSENPYRLGRYATAVTTIQVGTHRQPSEISDFHIFITTPNITNIKIQDLPVFAFETAFAGAVPANFYLDFFKHIASHGIIVVGLDTSDTSNSQGFQVSLAERLGYVVDWLQPIDGDNLYLILKENGIQWIKPDFSKFLLGGHSAGGHTVTQLMTFACHGVLGMVLLDPVDGYLPWEFNPNITDASSVIHPPSKVNFSMPLLHIDNLLDPISPFPDISFYPPCAPSDLSNDRFFDAWNGPSWQINATYYGHMDVVDITSQDLLNSIFDVFCAGNRSASNDPYIKLVGGSIVAFSSMLSGDDNSKQYLEDSSLMPSKTTLRQNYNNYQEPFFGFCFREKAISSEDDQIDPSSKSDPYSSNHSINSNAKLIAIIVSSVVAAVLIIILYFYFRRRTNKTEDVKDRNESSKALKNPLIGPDI